MKRIVKIDLLFTDICVHNASLSMSTWFATMLRQSSMGDSPERGDIIVHTLFGRVGSQASRLAI